MQIWKLCLWTLQLSRRIPTVQALKRDVNSESNQFIGTSREGKSTKIHAVVDGLGNLVYFQLTGGNVHDSTVTVDILSHLDLSDSTILDDKAYGTNEILDYIQRQDGDYVIPPKSNTRNPWRCDWVLYKERHLVECFFLKLKQFRCVATRYDRLASSFLAFVYLAAIAIWYLVPKIWFNP